MKTSSYDEENAKKIAPTECETIANEMEINTEINEVYESFERVSKVPEFETFANEMEINAEINEVLESVQTVAEVPVPTNEIIETEIDTIREARYVDCSGTELASPDEVVVQKVEVCTPPYSSERWSDTTSQISLPGQVDDVETVASDTEPVLAQCEPTSEMYYTASSEVSLLSDMEIPERPQEDEKETKDDRKECVIAGHVAAMRERFESMTRTNTPCPDLVRSLSPSLEVFRNTSPSPDRLP